MSRCVKCKFAVHDQFKGNAGRWMCFHPYRNEISDKGDFTYPGNFNPKITICETPASDYDIETKLKEALEKAKTPVWCYDEVVERSKIEVPGFDPDAQRAVLWPEKIHKTLEGGGNDG